MLRHQAAPVEWLDGEWIGEYLEEHPDALEYWGEDYNLIVSGTKSLQSFLAEYGKDWATHEEEPWIFERVD